MLHVITRMANGGSEQRLRDVLWAVDAEHEVVVGGESLRAPTDELTRRARVTWCPSLRRDVAPRDDLSALRQLVAVVRRGRFDVVHTHQAKAGLLGRLAARAGRRALVYHSASMASFGPGYGRLASGSFALAERLSAPLVDRYFVVGHDLCARLRANGVAAHRMQVVRSSLALAPFDPPTPREQVELRRLFGLDPAGVTLCYVGSLEARKGTDSLPELRAHVERACARPTQLVVAGSGPGEATLRSAATAPAVAAAQPGPAGAAPPTVPLRLLGHVPLATVAGVMRAADVLVLPSAAEGLPQVLVQAAACGLPFAAYDVDGVGEMLALGARGRRVPAGDRAGLADAVVDLVRESDGTARDDTARPGLAGELLRPWSADAVAGAYREAYGRDLAARGAAVSGRRDR